MNVSTTSAGGWKGRSRMAFLVAVVPLMIWATASLQGQQGTQKGEWRHVGGDTGSTRYAPLDQINRENFRNLQVAWRLKSDLFGPEFNWQTTPLVVNGLLYTTIGSRRGVVALDAATGELMWMYRAPDEGKRAQSSPRRGSGKGLAYWTDGKGDERIFYVTIGYQLVGLDAKTGRPAAGFGTNGIIDLKQNMDQFVDPITGELALTSPPAVARDVVIVGAAHLSSVRSSRNVKGYVRGFDVRTGKRLWIFHTIPSPGEFGNDTWAADSWSYTGNTGVWAQISVDEELGIVYLPVESATNDYYGGQRPATGKSKDANLFEDSLVAVDLHTGKRIWHYQLIHHGLWDWDIPAAPILGDVTVNGKRIKAVAQPTKQAFLYVFDRQTGEPIWPIEERPVPKGDVPGEWYSPTQPFPTKPPAYDLQGISLDDLIDFTPELKAEAVKVASQYKLGPIFTPPIMASDKPPTALIMMPAPDGGTSWAGGSFDPETGIAYVPSHRNTRSVSVAHDPKRPDIDYALGGPPGEGGEGGGGGGRGAAEGGGGRAINAVQGLPLVKLRWATLSAIDLNKGEILWQVPLGETPDSVRDHPALKGVTIPRTGAGTRHMLLTTKTLVISGERVFYRTAQGRGAMLRAYDKMTGENVGAVPIPAPETGPPMTYMVKDKQYLVIAVGGGNYTGELIAYKLP